MRMMKKKKGWGQWGGLWRGVRDGKYRYEFFRVFWVIFGEKWKSIHWSSSSLLHYGAPIDFHLDDYCCSESSAQENNWSDNPTIYYRNSLVPRWFQSLFTGYPPIRAEEGRNTDEEYLYLFQIRSAHHFLIKFEVCTNKFDCGPTQTFIFPFYEQGL